MSSSITREGSPSVRRQVSARKAKQIVTAVGAGVAGLTAACAYAPKAHAAQRTWNGASTTSSNWSDATNWGGTAPVTGDTLLFSGTARLSNTNDLTGLSIAGGTIAASAGSFFITGNLITLTADFTQSSTNAQQLDLPIALSGTRIFNINAGGTTGTLTFSGVLSGTGAFQKGNGSAANVFFTNANTYTGSTSMQANNPGALVYSGLGSATSSSSFTPAGGAVILDNSGTNLNDRVGNSATWNMQASQLTLIGNASAATTEQAGQLSVQGPNPMSTVTVDARAGGVGSLSFSSLSVATSSGLLLRGPNLGAAAGTGVAQILFGGSPLKVGTLTAGTTSAPILPGVIVDNSSTGAGTDFAYYDATNGVRALTPSEYANGLIVSSPANVKLIAAPTTPIANATINSLIFSGGGYTADLGGNTLTVNSGNVLNDATSAATRTLANGTLTFASSANGARVFNTGGTLDLAVSQINNGGAPLTFLGSGTTTVEAKISGSGGLNVTGLNSRVVLNAASDYSGVTTITGNGYLQFAVARAAASNAFGTNTVAISPAGAVELSGGITLPNAFITTGAGPGSQGVIRSLDGINTITGTLTMQGGAGSSNYQADAGSKLVFSGSVTANTTGRIINLQGAGDGLISGQIVDGTGANTLGGISKTGTGTWTISGTNNAFSGATTINGGTLWAVDGQSLPNGSPNNQGKSGNLKIVAGNFATAGTFTRGIGTGTNQVQITAGTSGFSAVSGTAVVDLGGDGTGTGPAAQWGSATFAPSTLVLNDTIADSLLDFRSAIDTRGTNASLTRFINVNSTLAPALISGAIVNSGTGLGSINKGGNGTLIVGGNAAYNGNLTVSAGAVLVTGNLGATATNAVTVNAGGTFGGNGNGSTTGIVTSAVTLSSGGGTLSPGMNGANASAASAGSLAVGSLAFSGGTNNTFLVDLVASSGSGAASATLAGTNYDSVSVLRTTGVTGTAVNLVLDDASYARTPGDQFFLIRGANGGANNTVTFRFAGTTLADGAQFGADANGVSYQINYNVADPTTGGKDVLLTVVPEPTALSLLGLTGAAFLGRRRRRSVR